MSVVTKNPYDLLGNTIEEEDDTPKQPPRIVEKATTHTVKRNADGVAPASRRAEGAIRDRDARAPRNKGTGEGEVNAPRGGAQARVRGGRGGRNPRTQDERHSKSTPHGGSDKTAALSWGAVEGEAELKDEQAGDAIAKADQKDAAAEGEAAVPAVEEEEDKSISYADYLVQQAEKKAALEAEAALKVRKANEGSKLDKKWAQAKELVKEAGEDYFAASGGKAQRQRERKQKQVVELENRFIEAPEQRTGGGRGGRGGPRGGRGGESSGRGRGGEGRGRGGPRGAPRGGDFPRGPRRGGDAGAAPVNPKDESAFPSLGSK